jgi:hypothetical protein
MLLVFPVAFFAVVATVVLSLVFSGHFLEAGRYDKAYEQRHREQRFSMWSQVPRDVS